MTQYTPGIYWIDMGEDVTVGNCSHTITPSKKVNVSWELLASDEIHVGVESAFYVMGRIERPDVLAFRKSDLMEPNFFWIRDLEDGTEMVVATVKAINTFGEEHIRWFFVGSDDEFTTEEIEADYEILGSITPPEA